MGKDNKRIREFVTTDTHGCADQLEQCLKDANFDFQHDKLIHLGDIVDRGPNSKGVVDLLLLVKNLVSIQGNHDEVWLEYLTTGVHPFEKGHGTPETFESYMQDIQAVDEDFNPVGEPERILFIPPAHKAFFERQVLHYTDDQNRFFCHAGYDRYYPIDQQHEDIFRWDRKLPYEIMCIEGKKVKRMKDVNEFSRVFFGHTPTINWKSKGKPITKPIYKAQFVNADTGGCFKDRGVISLIDITDDDNHILYQA